MTWGFANDVVLTCNECNSNLHIFTTAQLSESYISFLSVWFLPISLPGWFTKNEEISFQGVKEKNPLSKAAVSSIQLSWITTESVTFINSVIGSLRAAYFDCHCDTVSLSLWHQMREWFPQMWDDGLIHHFATMTALRKKLCPSDWSSKRSQEWEFFV